LVFTDQLGRAVRRGDGTRVGKVDDLIVVLGETDPYVVALRVRVGRRRRRVPWSAVASFAEEVVITADPTEDEVGGDELLLAGDVLDTQIFDLGGRRLTRVTDIELVWRDRELRVVGVDIGAAPLLRRLGLSVFARRAAAKVIPWSELHLTSVRGHEVQLNTQTARVHTLTEEELAELGARLPPHARSRLYARIRPHAAARAREIAARMPESQPRHLFGRVLRFRRHAPS
jgi:sporulation protein YlmC with PRC-barrel domain